MSARGVAASAPVAASPDVAMLAVQCGHSMIEHLQGAADELAGAGALANDAMAVLRGHFAAALAANARAADAAECHGHLEAAMVALQCEDALAQMLDHLQRRTRQMADVLRYVIPPRDDDADSVPADGGRSRREDMAARLRLAAVALDAGIARVGPVMQKRAVVGTVDLF